MMTQIFARIVQPGRRFLQGIRYRYRQFAAGVTLAEEDFRHRAPHPLPGKERFQQRFALAEPRHHHRIAIRQHHHDIRLDRRHFAN